MKVEKVGISSEDKLFLNEYFIFYFYFHFSLIYHCGGIQSRGYCYLTLPDSKYFRMQNLMHKPNLRIEIIILIINEFKRFLINFNLTKIFEEDIEGESPLEYEIYKIPIQEKAMCSKESCF